MTTQDISNTLNQLVNTYTGQRINANGVELGQCPAPVVRWLELLGIPTPSMYDDRADGWGVSFPDVLAPFFNHETYKAGKAYPEGTILMWNSPHIAIVISSTGGNTAKVFEQNADPDGAPCQTANRTLNTPTHTCTYALVPIIETPPPPATCTYSRITPVTLQTNKQPTNWWELNWTDINKAVAAAQLDQGTHFPAVGQAHHVSGQQYYMIAEDFGQADVTGTPVNNNGVNVNDLSPIPPPPPVIPVPVTPQLINSIPMAQAPNLTPYTLVVDVKSYNSAPNALTKPAGATVTVLKAGSDYYKFNTLNGMISLTKTPGLNMQWWINPSDNIKPTPPPIAPWSSEPAFDVTPIKPVVVTPTAEPEAETPPLPTSWKSTYKAFNKQNTSVVYKALYPVDVDDLDTKRPDIYVKKDQLLAVYGTVTFTDGVIYGRLKSQQDPGQDTPTWWYCIPMVDIRTRSKLKVINYIDLGFQMVMDIIDRRK